MISRLRNFIHNSSNQIDERILAITAILLVALAISYAAPAAQNFGKSQSAFPATTCPAKLGDGTSTAFLPKSKTAVRHVAKKSLKFYNSQGSTENILSSALLIDSNPGTSFAINTSANGLGSVICDSGSPDQWFVGGSGGLTSKAQLDIINSGLSPAVVEITGYSSKTVIPKVTVTVKANSDRTVFLDALVPGEDSVVLHVVTRSGRVTSFLFDQRRKGLAALGSDFVNSQAEPQRKLVIPTLMRSSNGNVSSTLRILVPGNLDANVKLTINSGDGAFTPLGFDGRTVPHGKVLDIPLADLTSTTPMSIIIDSDQPVVASALTRLTGGDFAWATPVAPLNTVALNFTGLSPQLVFTGTDINVGITWKNLNGKKLRTRVTGSDIAFWSPGKGGIKSVTFTADVKKPVYAGVILRTSSGRIAYLPLSAGAALEKSTLPLVDVHTLSR